ncbi:unnamed protein product [Discosporangium mesarthrocarpum]
MDRPELPPGSPCLVHPHSQWKIQWDLFVAVLIVYSTLTVPFRIGFDQTAGFFESVLDNLVDVAFVIDIITNFRTAMVDENGEPVVDIRAIAMTYLKGWFIVDFLSTIPVHMIANYLDGSNGNAVFRSAKLLRIMRLARLLKLTRLFKLGRLIGNSERESSMNPSFFSLGKMLLYMMYIAHILGCMWHWIATSKENQLSWVSEFGVDEENVSVRYVASIYWAFTTMTTVGYGDIVVTTTLERAFCVLGMLVGATVFGYIVGNVSVMMESFDVNSALHTEKMDRVKEYVQSQNFPQKFSTRFVRQYKYYLQRVSVFDSANILDSLPTTARTSLLFAQYHEQIEKLSFLQNNPPLFVTHMVGCLNPSYAKPGDVLFFQNEVGSDLFFVTAGKVNLFITFRVRQTSVKTRSPACKSFAHHEEPSSCQQSFLLGRVFQDSIVGEVGVMLDLPQPCAAVAVTQCDILTVNKEQLLGALDGWLDVQESLIQLAEKFVKRVENFRAGKGGLPDDTDDNISNREDLAVEDSGSGNLLTSMPLALSPKVARLAITAVNPAGDKKSDRGTDEKDKEGPEDGGGRDASAEKQGEDLPLRRKMSTFKMERASITQLSIEETSKAGLEERIPTINKAAVASIKLKVCPRSLVFHLQFLYVELRSKQYNAAYCL